MNDKTKVVLAFLIVSLVAVAMGLALSIKVFQPELPWQAWQQAGIYKANPVAPLAPFKLTDQNGQPFDNESLEGRWSFIFVGYTNCPDICPMTLATYQQLSKRLSDTGKEDQFRFIMLTADPARDTPERLKSYLGFFNAGFVGLSGDEEVTRVLAKSFNAGFRIPEHSSDAPYAVDHSTHISLISPDGQFVAFFQPPHNPELMIKVVMEIADNGNWKE